MPLGGGPAFGVKLKKSSSGIHLHFYSKGYFQLGRVNIAELVPGLFDVVCHIFLHADLLQFILLMRSRGLSGRVAVITIESGRATMEYADDEPLFADDLEGLSDEDDVPPLPPPMPSLDDLDGPQPSSPTQNVTGDSSY